jgi:hypothetical protein
VPTISDVFDKVGTGRAFQPYGTSPNKVDIATELPKYNSPDQRRLLHSLLAGLLEMPTNVAGSGATRYFLGTGAFKGQTKAGVGLLSSGNQWAKAANWKNADSERTVQALFADHYAEGMSEWYGLGGLLTQPDERFSGYPDEELWNAAYATAKSPQGPETNLDGLR